jgi:hypothetical protein
VKTVAVNASVQAAYQDMAQAKVPIYAERFFAGNFKPPVF